MQAANEGADAEGRKRKSVGIRVKLPFEQELNPFVGLAFEHHFGGTTRSGSLALNETMNRAVESSDARPRTADIRPSCNTA